MEKGLVLKTGQVVTICLLLASGFTGTIYTAFAQQSQKEDIVEIKQEQKEKHAEINKKFETVMKEITKTNLHLARAVTLLEERTGK